MPWTFLCYGWMPHGADQGQLSSLRHGRPKRPPVVPGRDYSTELTFRGMLSMMQGAASIMFSMTSSGVFDIRPTRTALQKGEGRM